MNPATSPNYALQQPLWLQSNAFAGRGAELGPLGDFRPFTVIAKLLFGLLLILYGSIAPVSGAPTANEPASIVYLGSQPTKFGKGTVYRFRLTNTSWKSLFYCGYASDHPAYTRLTQRWFQWRKYRYDLAGGRAFYRLAPGDSFVFYAYRGDYWPWRVGIRLSPRPDRAVAESKGITVWSLSVR
jgi:hypothetical protein